MDQEIFPPPHETAEEAQITQQIDEQIKICRDLTSTS